jgi:predicted RNA-binding protein YlxR (DUF448 family)
LQQKKIPMRMCVGCNEMKPKRELVRVVKNKEGVIFIDATGKAGGRGAYLCRSGDCLARARKSRRLERAFSAQIPDEVYARLEGELQNAE